MCTSSDRSADDAGSIRLVGAPPWVEAARERARDGRTVHTIVNRRNRTAFVVDDSDLGPDGGPIPALAAALERAGVVGPTAWADVSPSATRSTWPARVYRAITRLEVRVRCADRVVRVLHRAGLRHLFGRTALTIQVLLALLGGAAVVQAVVRHAQLELAVPAGRLPEVLAAGLAALAAHEFAHALVIVHYGRCVDAIGVRLHLGTPAMYVESVDALLLTRRQRIVQAAAGPWAEWIFTSLAALVLLGVHDGPGEVLMRRFVVLSALNVLLNLLPFVDLDGALILADLLRFPDLHYRARGAAGRLVTTLVRGGRPRRGQVALGAYTVTNSMVAVALFGLAAWMWIQLFGDALRSLWRAGPVGVAALMVATAFVGRPAVVLIRPRCADLAATAAGLVRGRRSAESSSGHRPARSAREAHGAVTAD